MCPYLTQEVGNCQNLVIAFHSTILKCPNFENQPNFKAFLVDFAFYKPFQNYSKLIVKTLATLLDDYSEAKIRLPVQCVGMQVLILALINFEKATFFRLTSGRIRTYLTLSPVTLKSSTIRTVKFLDTTASLTHRQR